MSGKGRSREKGELLTVGGVGLEEGSKDEGLHSHQLDEDVQGWAGGVLQRVADSIADDCSLVRVRALASQGASVLCGLGLHPYCDETSSACWCKSRCRQTCRTGGCNGGGKRFINNTLQNQDAYCIVVPLLQRLLMTKTYQALCPIT